MYVKDLEDRHRIVSRPWIVLPTRSYASLSVRHWSRMSSLRQDDRRNQCTLLRVGLLLTSVCKCCIICSIKDFYHNHWTEMFVATLILASFIANLLENQLNPGLQISAIYLCHSMCVHGSSRGIGPTVEYEQHQCCRIRRLMARCVSTEVATRDTRAVTRANPDAITAASDNEELTAFFQKVDLAFTILFILGKRHGSMCDSLMFFVQNFAVVVCLICHQNHIVCSLAKL